MPDKVEFASAAWIAGAKDVLEDLIANAKQDLSGVTFNMCEVFTDAPEHIALTDDGKAGWHFRVKGKTIEVAAGEIDDADFKIIADYTTVLPLAKIIYGKYPAGMKETQRIQAEGAKSGKMRTEGEQSKMPPQLMPILMLLHNKMAERTV